MAQSEAQILALPAGSLRHQVTFLQQGTTSDVSGTSITWTDYCTARASVDPFKGAEVIKAGIDTSQVFITVKMRYRDDVDASMRLRAQHGTYIIQCIENLLERN